MESAGSRPHNVMFRVQPTSGEPIYQQVVRQAKHAVATFPSGTSTISGTRGTHIPIFVDLPSGSMRRAESIIIDGFFRIGFIRDVSHPDLNP